MRTLTYKYEYLYRDVKKKLLLDSKSKKFQTSNNILWQTCTRLFALDKKNKPIFATFQGMKHTIIISGQTIFS